MRTVRGSGLALSMGRLPGALCSKYMLVDGEKVMFGSYRSVTDGFNTVVDCVD